MWCAAPVFTDLAALEAAISIDRERLGPEFQLVFASAHCDPPHKGHADYLLESATVGTHLLVVINGNEACVRKRGYYFLHEDDRCRIVSCFGFVDYVLLWQGTSMEEVIRAVRPASLTNGGDRSDIEAMNPLEVQTCWDVKCRVVCGVGGEMKQNSSSQLVKRAALALGYRPPPD